MKNLKMTLASMVMFATVVFASAGCTKVVNTVTKTIEAKGPMVSQERKISAVSALDVTAGMSVNYVQSNELKAVVEAPQNVVDLIMTEVSGSTLKIYPKQSVRGAYSMRVTVFAPMIVKFDVAAGSSVAVEKGYTAADKKVDVEVSSGATMTVASVQAAGFDVECSSGASCSVDGIMVGQLQGEASSGASLHLGGTASAVQLSGSSGAAITAGDLKADGGSLKASSGASIIASVHNASIHRSGGGSVVNN